MFREVKDAPHPTPGTLIRGAVGNVYHIVVCAGTRDPRSIVLGRFARAHRKAPPTFIEPLRFVEVIWPYKDYHVVVNYNLEMKPEELEERKKIIIEKSLKLLDVYPPHFMDHYPEDAFRFFKPIYI